MKMVKSLLLGSAAGLVAVAGAQAADLPVKAKPVQYVKICSLYGVGFYYIPGTDMCLKIGGWVRAEYTYGANGNIAWGWANANANSRATNNSTWRARGYITADARNQTEYGTVRGYIAVGLNTSNTGADTASNTFSSNRAFIQWAGFTFGLAQSFYDFYSTPATSYWGSFPASDTGDGGWMVAGYTAQFGNGFSATIAAEMRRNTQIDGLAGTEAPGAIAGNYGGFQAPDVVANLRVDQAWGSAQLMAAYHEVNSTYYLGTPGAAFGGVNGWGAYGGFQAPDVVMNLRVDQAWGSAQIMGAAHQVKPLYYGFTEPSGHPDNSWGFAVGAGIKLNAPMIGQGDYLQAQVNYTEGASRYVFQTPNSNWGKVDGNTIGLGTLSDSVWQGNLAAGNASSQELTTAWGVNAAYEHFWNPRWRSSLYGGYAAVSYNDRGNAMLCSFIGDATGTGTAAVANAGCDNNWSTWWIGSRTQWNVTKDFYMGLDVLYSKLQTMNTSTGLAPLTIGGSACVNGGAVTARCALDDQDNWSFRFRVHRDFYP